MSNQHMIWKETSNVIHVKNPFSQTLNSKDMLLLFMMVKEIIDVIHVRNHSHLTMFSVGILDLFTMQRKITDVSLVTTVSLPSIY